MQLTDWLLAEVALLLIGLAQHLLDKIRFLPPVCFRITSQAAGLGGESFELLVLRFLRAIGRLVEVLIDGESFIEA
jgi:hypothetical protein